MDGRHGPAGKRKLFAVGFEQPRHVAERDFDLGEIRFEHGGQLLESIDEQLFVCSERVLIFAAPGKPLADGVVRHTKVLFLSKAINPSYGDFEVNRYLLAMGRHSQTDTAGLFASSTVGPMTRDDGRIELRDVGKRYGPQAVLEGVSLAVPRGQFVVVLGRSGSGKSTLLRLIGGLESPDRGTILFDGKDLGAVSEFERAGIRRSSLGFVFQFFNLVPTLTVAENVELPLALNGVARADVRRRGVALLAELDVERCATRFPEELSGGEQQRVAIARAVIHEPKLVLADEPTGNLDLETSASVLELLEGTCRRRNATLVMATHSREVAGHADRVLTIRNARLEDGSA
jgi:putative ABC transport system ATP-binding protein